MAHAVSVLRLTMLAALYFASSVLRLGFGELKLILAWQLAELGASVGVIGLVAVINPLAESVMAIPTALLADIAPVKDRGAVMGLYDVIFASGGTIGPSVGGLIAEWAGTNSLFWACSLLALLGALFVIQVGKAGTSSNPGSVSSFLWEICEDGDQTTTGL